MVPAHSPLPARLRHPYRIWPLLARLATAFLGAPGPAAAGSAEDRGLEIARDADKANEGFGSEKATMTLELINAHGDVITRKMRMELLEGNDGDKSLSVFEWPADVKGTKLLTFTHKKDDDDQWLYLPAIKRVKRIASNNKSGSFMGSEFAYEDLSAQEVEKFSYKYLTETKLGDRDCWQLERYPVDKNSGYSRQIVWMDKQYKEPLMIEYYDRKNELLKVSTFTGYKKHGKYWRWTTIAVKNVQTKKKSVLTWQGREMGAKIDASLLDSAAMEQ